MKFVYFKYGDNQNAFAYIYNAYVYSFYFKYFKIIITFNGYDNLKSIRQYINASNFKEMNGRISKFDNHYDFDKYYAIRNYRDVIIKYYILRTSDIDAEHIFTNFNAIRFYNSSFYNFDNVKNSNESCELRYYYGIFLMKQNFMVFMLLSTNWSILKFHA